MRVDNRELVDRLAGEYVLGTLRGHARQHFERWLVSPRVAAIVKAWEDRLAGLEPPLQQLAPPLRVWDGIEKRLGLRKPGRAPALRWAAMAASLVLFLVLGYFALRSPSLPATQVALLRENPQTIYWRVELLGDNQEISVQASAPHALEAGKALELWALPEGGKPVSLGLLPARGELRRALTAAQRTALAGARNLAVSLEPAGGSPTGLPTGPVLHVAALARA